MDRDQSIKLNETLTAIKTSLASIKSDLDAIKTSQATIATNTTPASSGGEIG